ncbi:MFS transporter [Plantactinospora veratri]
MEAAMGTTRTALAVPGALPMAVWSVLGRFAFAMINLSLLIFVEDRTGSYAVAGAVSAASLVGTAVGVIGQSRLIDRYGPTRVLLAFTGPYALLSVGAVVFISTGLNTLALALLVAVQCAVLPTVQVASRAMWRHLVPAGSVRDAAYSYEAVSFELCWLLGPAVAAVLATWLWSGSALLVAVTLSTVSAAGFASTAAVRSHRRHATFGTSAEDLDRAADGTDADQFHPAGLAILLLATCAFGLTVGFVVVGVTAGTESNGVPQLAGVVLGLWSISSVLVGMAYQRSPWPRPLVVRLPVLIAGFGTILLIPSLLGGALPLTVAVILAGATLVPQITLHNTLLDRLVPQRRVSEAFGWITTAIIAANAAGQALGGLVIQRYDYNAGFLTAATCAVSLAAAVWVGRRKLIPKPAAA